MTNSPATDPRLDGVDPEELSEWEESFEQLLRARGRGAAAAVRRALAELATSSGLGGRESVTTDYVNTIGVEREPVYPGDEALERAYRHTGRGRLTVADVEEFLGVPGFLDDLRASVKAGTFRPLPVRERKIPSPVGRERSAS